MCVEDSQGEIYGASGDFTVFSTESPSPFPTIYKMGCDSDSLELTAPGAKSSFLPDEDITVSWTASASCMDDSSSVRIHLMDGSVSSEATSTASKSRSLSPGGLSATISAIGFASVLMSLPVAVGVPTASPTSANADDVTLSSSGCIGNDFTSVYNTTTLNSGSMTLDIGTLDIDAGEDYFICIEYYGHTSVYDTSGLFAVR